MAHTSHIPRSRRCVRCKECGKPTRQCNELCQVCDPDELPPPINPYVSQGVIVEPGVRKNVGSIYSKVAGG